MKRGRNVLKFQYFPLFVIMIKEVATGIVNITKTIQNFVYLFYVTIFIALFISHRWYFI